jgi:hypothetical protein
MAITVKAIKMYRGTYENKPGVLAGVLNPVVGAGANLQILMGYRMGEGTAAIELYPVAGKKAAAAAQSAGLAAMTMPALLVQGDDKPGLGHAIARTLADAGINLQFLVAQTIGRRFTAVFGLENEADARKSAGLIKKAAAPKKK